MSVLLGKFDNLYNIELHDIVNCYQDYFTFKINGDSTLLYLDTKTLKYYLKEGLNIKYRKYGRINKTVARCGCIITIDF